MDNLTLGKMLMMLAWAITLPLWFPLVWAWRKLFGRPPDWSKDRGRPFGATLPWMLVPFWMMGCTDTPESRVEKTEAEITRALNNAKKVATELAKAEKTIADEKAKLADLIAKLNGLIAPAPPPNPSPNPNPAPSPVPTPVPGPPTPGPVPSPTPSEPVDGRFAIARAVWKIGSAVASPDRAAEAQALSLVFASVASQVAAGTLDGTLLDPQWHKISVALTAGNKPIMAKHLAAWKSAAEQLSEAIATFYSDDKLKSNSDWSDLLNEISSGLKAVK